MTTPLRVFPTARDTARAGQVEKWAAAVAGDSRDHACTTIGLMCGSRRPNDRRTIDELARHLSENLRSWAKLRPLLVVRLDVFPSKDLDRGVDQPAGAPRISRCPLGNWMETDIPVPIGRRASWSLQQIPRWLPAWKREYSAVLLDLGPMNQVPSRAIGRLCDDCYVLLGPNACASSEWIQQHLAWHDRSGSQITGSLLTTLAKAA